MRFKFFQKIKNIQNKPESERIKILWTLVAIFMVGVVAIFIYSLKNLKIENGQKIFGGMEEMKKELKMPELPDFKEEDFQNLPKLPGEVKGETDENSFKMLPVE